MSSAPSLADRAVFTIAIEIVKAHPKWTRPDFYKVDVKKKIEEETDDLTTISKMMKKKVGIMCHKMQRQVTDWYTKLCLLADRDHCCVYKHSSHVYLNLAYIQWKDDILDEVGTARYICDHCDCFQFCYKLASIYAFTDIIKNLTSSLLFSEDMNYHPIYTFWQAEMECWQNNRTLFNTGLPFMNQTISECLRTALECDFHIIFQYLWEKLSQDHKDGFAGVHYRKTCDSDTATAKFLLFNAYTLNNSVAYNRYSKAALDASIENHMKQYPTPPKNKDSEDSPYQKSLNSIRTMLHQFHPTAARYVLSRNEFEILRKFRQSNTDIYVLLSEQLGSVMG